MPDPEHDSRRIVTGRSAAMVVAALCLTVSSIAIVTDKTWSTRQQLGGHTDAIASAGLSPDGLMAYTCGHDCTVKLWDAASGKCLVSIPTEGWPGTPKAAFKGAERLLVFSSHRRPFSLWDTVSAKRLLGPVDEELLLMLSSGCAAGTPYIASQPEEGMGISVFTTFDGTRAASLRPVGAHVVPRVLYDTANRTMAVASDAAHVPVFSLPGGDELGRLEGHEDGCTRVVGSGTGDVIAVLDGKHTVRCFDSAAPYALLSNRTIEGARGLVPLNDRLGVIADAGDSRELLILDPRTCSALGRAEGVLIGLGRSSQLVALRQTSPDAGLNRISVWDVARESETISIPIGDRHANAAFISSNGDRLAASMDGQSTTVWSLPDGDRLAVFAGESTLRQGGAAAEARVLVTFEGAVARVWQERRCVFSWAMIRTLAFWLAVVSALTLLGLHATRHRDSA